MATDERATAVFLHGFTHTGASWAPVIESLGAMQDLEAEAQGQPYRAIAPDVRGHGSASDVVPVDLEHVIADVARQHADTFTLVGYSMGGRIALHIALTLPARVERLVLIGASPGIADPAQRAARRAADERLASQLESSTIEEFATSWAQTPVLADQPRDVAAAVHADRLRSTPAGLARALRGLGTGALPSLWETLGELAIPTLLVVGERDLKFAEIAAAMARQIPAGEVIIVPDSGHAVHLERAAATASIITRARGPLERLSP
jgi:2-succinyl-6-hydroxy-2,4-cyclohexadiene-1-carboxylate synthase